MAQGPKVEPQITYEGDLNLMRIRLRASLIGRSENCSQLKGPSPVATGAHFEAGGIKVSTCPLVIAHVPIEDGPGKTQGEA